MKIATKTTHKTILIVHVIYWFGTSCTRENESPPNIISGRNENDLHQGIYDMDFHPLDMSFASSNKKPQEYAKPAHFDLMKEYAAKLSEGLTSARIDFFDANNEVYRGEITLTPAAGNFGFDNRETTCCLARN